MPRIKAIGEIALRVSDLDAMHKFYEKVLGLGLMKRFEHAAFFRIKEGYKGHTQILALFDRSGQPDYEGLDPNKSPIDHLAFEIDLEDYEAEKKRLTDLNVIIREDVHQWVKWRSIYFTDPDGNTVELVCHDPGI